MARRYVFALIVFGVFVFAWMKRGAIVTAAKGLSDSALKLIAGFEGFSAVPYADAKGQSVGFGHFIQPGDAFTFPMSENTAYTLLQLDVGKYAGAVSDMVKVPLTQGQHDALVSLAYNIGIAAFQGSTLLRKLNAGDYSGAAAEFPRWNKSQGVVLAELTARRATEQKLFKGA